jgi:hypothetical protein
MDNGPFSRPRRWGGLRPVTYNHHPLYTFVKDTGKGQTNGEGVVAFGAEWDALSSGGAKVEKKNDAQSTGSDPAPAPTPAPTPAPGGYSY